MKKIHIIILGIVLLSVFGCHQKQTNSINKFVDPFIGTGAHGHTYPGTSLPFAMVQLSPDTRLDTWDGCSGYHYSDSSIIGFSHTHLSGTGVSDYGDILFQPFSGNNQWNPGNKLYPDSGYRSRFSHQDESASPGYYQVKLNDDNINVELTSTKRVGFHQYNFPLNQNAKIILDLSHRDPLMEANIRQISETEIEGYRVSKFWSGEQHVYFVARFSKPIKNILWKKADSSAFIVNPNDGYQKAIFEFGETNKVLMKVAISAVDFEGARSNLLEEINHWDFEKTKKQARDEWEEQLSKIKVQGGINSQKRIFYTAYYHSLLTPNIYSDVDGRYRGMDLSIHQDKKFTNYTVFSLWDTFRGLHPLLTITHPDKATDFCNSLIKKGEQFGEIPMWELASNDTRCMIGYHGVSIIADAILKNTGNINIDAAYQIMIKSANENKRGINYYKELGFVPYNRSSQAVSKTLEYAYDDWCIAQVAKKLGETSDYYHYMARSQFYKNTFDEETGFMRPRNDKREWEKDFDPMRVGYSYTEGNSFQYSLFVPHDIEGLKQLIGGEEAFENWLDQLFNTEIDHELEEDSDVTGLIGNYAHGNEPSHHLAYLYNYTDSPWKTQKFTHQIINDLYQDNPDGICGNEDCGQMSAWYVLSSLGFYSISPGSNTYAISSPIFDDIKMELDNGNIFHIQVSRKTKKSKYIQSMRLNGEEYYANFLKHEDILNGGTLEFELTNDPEEAMEFTLSDQKSFDPIVSIPFVVNAKQSFNNSTKIDLHCETKGAQIFYTTDNSTPTINSTLYTKPIAINKSVLLQAIAIKTGYYPSVIFKKQFNKSKPITSIKLKPGLKFSVYNGIYRSVYDWTNDDPVQSGVCKTFSNSYRDRDEWYGMHFDGYIRIPRDGNYTFLLKANDGCQMIINGDELFESDGRKGHSLDQSYTLDMKEGFHKIDIKYYQCSDKNELNVFWESKTIKREIISSQYLFHKD